MSGEFPVQAERLATLDRLGAPTFVGVGCPACSAAPGELCSGLSGSAADAHQRRIDRAFAIAYRKEA